VEKYNTTRIAISMRMEAYDFLLSFGHANGLALKNQPC